MHREEQAGSLGGGPSLPTLLTHTGPWSAVWEERIARGLNELTSCLFHLLNTEGSIT